MRKNRLVRADQAKYQQRAEELQAAGVACEIPEEWQVNSRSLDVFVAPSWENFLTFSNGFTECAISVHLVALHSNLILEDFAIASEWDSEFIAVQCRPNGLYSAEAGFEFTKHEALNHRIENGLRLRRRGDVATGWVVATSQTPIPAKYRNHTITRLHLTFTDQFGYDHSAQGTAVLEKRTSSKHHHLQVRQSPGLFEDSSAIPVPKDRETPADLVRVPGRDQQSHRAERGCEC